MSRFERRVRALEQKHKGDASVVFVFPTETSPDHRFHSDEAYYQDLAESRYGMGDFELAVWPGDDDRAEPELMFVENVATLLKNIRVNSTRAGVEPGLNTVGGR